MNYPRITLPRKTVTGLRRKLKFNGVKVKTTFIDERGPKLGTIWFDSDPKVKTTDFRLHIVHAVTEKEVNYVEGWDYLDNFMEHVASGRYVLVGVTPETHNYTVL